MQHLYFHCVFHRFPCNTYVFLAFFVGSHATPMFPLRVHTFQAKNMFSYGFRYLPTQHFSFPFVFLRFLRNTCVSLCFHKFLRKTCVFISFPNVPTQHMCLPYVFYRFPRNTLGSCVFHRFLRTTCVFFGFSIGSHASFAFSLRPLNVPTQHLCFSFILIDSYVTL